MLAKRIFRIVLVTPGKGIGMAETKEAQQIAYDGKATSTMLGNK